MNVLILGASGFVGSVIHNEIKGSIGTYFSSPIDHGIQVDLRSEDSVKELFAKVKPDVVVHCAGIVNIRKCEEDPEDAKATHLTSTQYIVKHIGDAHLIFFSTDYVFDGEKGMYAINDPLNPWTVYGKMKVLAEAEVKKCKHWTIGRTSGVLGWAGKNILPFIIGALNEKTTFFTDVYNSPTNVYDLSRMVQRIISEKIEGVLHLCGNERVNRLELALAVAKAFSLDEHNIVAEELGVEERKRQFRPRDVSLSTTESENILSMKFQKLDEALVELKGKKP